MARPSTPLISRELAAEAALQVIDELGVAGCSLDRVAKKLNVRSPSLYHYFRDKDELLEEVVRLLFANLPSLANGSDSYEERLVELCVKARRSLIQHPNAAVLVLQHFPRRLMLAAYEDTAKTNPYPPEFHMLVIEASEKLMFGTALFEAAAIARGAKSFPDFNTDQYAHLAKALSVVDGTDQEEFLKETLRIFFVGLAQRYRNGSIGQPVDESRKLFPQ
ncbi:MAG: TetR/AcrR family transcriptional regulator [Janthinobacterium lividum]